VSFAIGGISSPQPIKCLSIHQQLRQNRVVNFETELKRLNKAQREAVDTIEGPVMVVAGPGTGKTQVLTLRIANIIKKTDTPPESVLALTFTESAVAAMRKRLVEIMGAEAYRVSIKTIHGFCNEVIQDYPEEFSAIAGATSITEVQQIDVVRNLLDADTYELLRPFNEPYKHVREITDAIRDLKKEGVLPEGFEKIVAEERASFDQTEDLYNEKGAHKGKMKGKYQTQQKQIEKHGELARIYVAYQRELRRQKIYDFNDMVIEVAHELTQNEALLFSLQEKYLYVLVDEHQDTNSSQNKVIELLASYDKSPNLFIVGDEKQAIFRFQGASVENFTYFQKRFKGAKLITLTENYRSHQTILDAAVDIALGKGPLRAQAKHKAKPIRLATFSHPDVERYAVAAEIQHRIQKEGVLPEEIAILYRTNSDAAPIARMLEKMGVPFVVQSDEDALEDTDMRKVFLLLEAVQNFGQDYALIPALYIDFFDIPPLDVALLIEAAREHKSKVFPLVRDPKILEKIIPHSARKVFELYQKLSLWKAMSKNNNLVEVFEAVVRDSGCLAHLMQLPHAQEKLAKVHALFDELQSLVQAQHSATLEDFLAHIAIIREHRLQIKSSLISTQASAVRLMTAHKAKGLEFEYVYIIGATLGHWGSRRSRDFMKLPPAIYMKAGAPIAEDDESDERNLFYVALTRAKKEACISYASKNADGKDQLVSEFIESIRPALIAKVPVEKIEQEFATHRDIAFAKAPEADKNKVSAEYLAFLRKRFKEKGLSVSALNAYLNCPQQFLFTRLIGIPEAPNKALQYGSAVHAALQFLNNHRAKGVSKAQVLKVFKNNLQQQPISERDLADTLKKGERVLSAYYDRTYKTWPVNSLAEQSVYGIKIGEIEIGGKIDRIDINEDGRATVIDYKTGKSKSRNELAGLTKDASGDNYRQLVFYKLLLERGKKFHIKEGVIDFVEPDTKGKFHREVFAPSDKEVSELEVEIGAMAKAVLAGEFVGCHEKDCKYCNLSR
jgi:DNA helicase-2/ATP-dependent DNA helicase PcrA